MTFPKALQDALEPFAPFQYPLPVPVASPTDEPLITVCVNREWVPYIMGALHVFRAASTWGSQSPDVVAGLINDAETLIGLFMEMEPCPVPIQFQINPDYVQNWQYSLDGGTTWLDGPDTATNFVPSFTVDGTAPGGYELSVNDGHSATDIPLLTAVDAQAIVKDPSSTLTNLITASSGAEGLVVQALATIGVQLVQSNGIALALNKIPLFGLATSALETLAGGTDYTFDLLAMLT